MRFEGRCHTVRIAAMFAQPFRLRLDGLDRRRVNTIGFFKKLAPFDDRPLGKKLILNEFFQFSDAAVIQSPLPCGTWPAPQKLIQAL